jgi:GDPmannose 4,6-dehydratase
MGSRLCSGYASYGSARDTCRLLIATGITNSLRDFVDAAFAAFGLNSSDHLQTDSSLLRPSDLRYSVMAPTRIHAAFGWKSSLGLPEIIERMMEGSMAC